MAESSGNIQLDGLYDQIKNKKFYEMEQRLKTIIVRFNSKKKFDESINFIENCIKKIDETGETQEASQIVLNVTNILTDTLVKAGLNLSQDLLVKLIEIHSKVDWLPDKVRVWVKINNKFHEGKNETILEFLSKDALSNKSYSMAQTFSVHCSNLSLSKELIIEWSKSGKYTEVDIFVIRYIMLKLTTKRKKDAEQLFKFFKEEGYLDDSLLANMLKFTFKAIDMNSVEIFEKLADTYERSLQRDPDLQVLLEKIGEMYLQYKKPVAQQNNMLQMMMQNMMKM